jgi:hypothetical protein
VVRYFEEYRDKGYGDHYGLPNRPLYREGAGCSAFGASFVKTAGILTEEFQRAWTQTIAVPLKYVGGPLTGRSVPFWKLFFSWDIHWAKGGEPSKSVTFYDPEAIRTWILAKVKAKEPGYEVAQRNGCPGIIFDATKTSVPSGPIWQAP